MYKDRAFKAERIARKKLKHRVVNICMWLASAFMGIWFLCALATGLGYIFI